MHYDFTTLVDRSALGSAKWAAMHRANPDVPPGIPPFSVADLDLPNAPEIIEGLKEFLDQAVLGYTRPTASYTGAVIDWMARRHGWQVRAESIVETSGVVPALSHAVRAFSEPGDAVIVQPPVYYPFFNAVRRNGRRLVENALRLHDGRYEIDFDHLAHVAADPRARLLLFCTPHNPVGRVWTRAELERLADIVLAHDLILVSDDIHFDLVLPGHRHTVISTLGAEIAARSIVCTAPSKSFNLAGMAASNIVIEDATLRARFQRELESAGHFFLTTLGYKACELAYTRGEAWLDGLIDLIARNAAHLRTRLAAELPNIEMFPLEGTYLAWMDFRALGKSADELKRIHQHEALVFFDEGGVFGKQGEGFERMNIATPTHALDAALDRLVKAHAPRA